MNKNDIMSTEQAKVALKKFSDALAEISKKNNQKLNIFHAVGMCTQEIKHSVFFAWLLDPGQSHGLGNMFTRKFFERLLDKSAPQSDMHNVHSNAEILAAQEIYKISDLEDFLADSNWVAEKEKVLQKAENRMDIFVESQKTKTIFVIENKMFTTTHGDQLKRYKEETEIYNGWRRIFVYLTPFGDLPLDADKYREDWCIFSYEDILEICRELLRELPRSKQNHKLLILLEDYIDMVDTNILKGNKELRALCKSIRREHKDALKILDSYSDNVEQAIKYISSRLNANIAGFRLFKETKLLLEFKTEELEKFFERAGESHLTEGKRLKFRYSVSCINGDITASVCLEKDRFADWSKAQLRLREKFLSNRTPGELYCSKNLGVLLSEEGREKEFEEIQEELDSNLLRLIETVHGIESQLAEMS